MDRLGRCEAEMRWAQAVELPLEMALIELCGRSARINFRGLIRRIEALEAKLAALGAGSEAALRPAPLPSPTGEAERADPNVRPTGPVRPSSRSQLAERRAGTRPSPAGRRRLSQSWLERTQTRSQRRSAAGARPHSRPVWTP